MAYNPAEGNNPYSDEQLAKEWEAYNKRPFGSGLHKTPDEIRMLKREFCRLLEKGCTVTKALSLINGDEAFFGSATVRLGRKTVYAWRQYDPEFKANWDEAYAIGTDKFEQRIADYAMEEDPKQINNILKYRNPRRYAVTRQEVSGPDGGPLQVDTIELVAATSEDDEGSA